MSTLRLILGDQLSLSISSLDGCDQAKDIILMRGAWDEATYANVLLVGEKNGGELAAGKILFQTMWQQRDKKTI